MQIAEDAWQPIGGEGLVAEEATNFPYQEIASDRKTRPKPAFFALQLAHPLAIGLTQSHITCGNR